MAYMYCNHTGCNETVKVPNKYCYKHTPKKPVADKELLDLIEQEVKPKKTTK